MGQKALAREAWTTTLAFVVASMANAVGLGNVWRFPYICGQYGGAAFVVVYLLAVVALGVPLMMAEFSVGRYARKNAVASLRTIAPKTPWWLLGYQSVIVTTVVLTFYSSVAGWVLRYVVHSALGSFSGLGPEQIGASFGAFLNSPVSVIAWQALVMAYTVYVVGRGIRGGIEKVCLVMMPALLLMEIILAIWAATLPGAGEGLAFYLRPDFSKLTMAGVLAAMGQVFFSLNVGSGNCLVYASYESKERTLFGSALKISAGDTAVALLAGLVIFPAAFAFGVKPDQGPGLLFVTMPNVFSHMAGGRLFGAIFYLFIAFAALTSTIGILEVPTQFMMEQFGWRRPKAAVFFGALVFAIGVLSSLSFGPLADFKVFFGRNFFEFEDFLVSYVLLPVGGILYAIFVGWVWGIKPSIEEINTGGGMRAPASYWGGTVKYIVPVLVFVILLTGLM